MDFVSPIQYGFGSSTLYGPCIVNCKWILYPQHYGHWRSSTLFGLWIYPQNSMDFVSTLYGPCILHTVYGLCIINTVWTFTLYPQYSFDFVSATLYRLWLFSTLCGLLMSPKKLWGFCVLDTVWTLTVFSTLLRLRILNAWWSLTVSSRLFFLFKSPQHWTFFHCILQRTTVNSPTHVQRAKTAQTIHKLIRKHRQVPIPCRSDPGDNSQRKLNTSSNKLLYHNTRPIGSFD